MVAAAAVGGIVSAGSAAYAAKQARKASKAQVEAGNAASALEKESADAQLALQKQIWEKQQADQLPYLQQGQSAIGKLIGRLIVFIKILFCRPVVFVVVLLTSQSLPKLLRRFHLCATVAHAASCRATV